MVVCRIGAKDAWIGEKDALIGGNGAPIGGIASPIGANFPAGVFLGCEKPPPHPHPSFRSALLTALDKNLENFSGAWPPDGDSAAPGHGIGGQAAPERFGVKSGVAHKSIA